MPSGTGRVRVVVLGAHFGGLAVLHWLHRLVAKAVDVVVVAAKPYAVFKPDLVFSAYARPRFVGAARIDLSDVCRRLGVRLVVDYALAVEPDLRRVRLANRPPLPYDVLFLATGMDWAWELIPGLGPETGFLCEDYASRHVAARMAGWRGGRIALWAGPLVQGPASPPAPTACECPLVEWVLMAHGHLRSQGRRTATRFALVTPARALGEELGPRAQARVAAHLAGAGVQVVTGARVREVTADGVVFESADGRVRRMRPDLSVWMPPAAGSALARRSGLDDGWGWVPTDGHMRHVALPDLYAVGDINAVTVPKRGHTAMVQARVAVHHLARRLGRRVQAPPYRPSSLSLLHLGGGRALLDWTQGRQEVMWEGRGPHLLKRAFSWAYRRGGGGLPLMP
ncbi:MAG: FAD-dependent oxidoreductase [Firmicutes bacterium]|nr:FAD-dependent oxidoreductase [Bacillota bacterium]